MKLDELKELIANEGGGKIVFGIMDLRIMMVPVR